MYVKACVTGPAAIFECSCVAWSKVGTVTPIIPAIKIERRTLPPIVTPIIGLPFQSEAIPPANVPHTTRYSKVVIASVLSEAK